MKVVRRPESVSLLVQSVTVAGTELEGVVGSGESTLRTAPDRLLVALSEEKGNKRDKKEKQDCVEIPPAEHTDGETRE